MLVFRTLCSICILPFTCMALMAQAAPDPAPQTVPDRMQSEQFWAIGVQAGLATGMGVSLRTTFANRFAVEAQGGYLSMSDGVWSFGLEGQFLLDHAFDHRLYALAGFGAYFDGDTASNNTLDAAVRGGIGIGYDYFLGSKTVLSLELPVTFFFGKEKVTVIPIPQIQFLYYFN